MASEGEPPKQTSLSELIASIASINASAVTSVEEVPDSKTRLELAELQIQVYKERIRSLGQDIDERKKYAHRIFCFMCAWLAGTFLILLLQGFGNGKWFFLPAGVLLAMIGGTTADVLGIFYIVTHYLFPTASPFPEETKIDEGEAQDSDEPEESA